MLLSKRWIIGKIATTLILVFWCFGCGQDPDSMAHLDRVVLIPSDTVITTGEQIGDSVFSIGDFQLSGDHVYFLDYIGRHVVRINPVDGSREFIGCSGEAPGEFLSPMALVVTGGIVRVMDSANGLICFDTSGAFIDSLSFQAANLPLGLCPVDSMGYLGLRSSSFLDDEGELTAQVSVGLFSTDDRPSDEYFIYSMQMNPSQIADSFYGILTAVRFTADETTGTVFISPRSEDRMTVISYSKSDEENVLIDQSLEEVEWTPTRIAVERLALASRPYTTRISDEVVLEGCMPQVSSLGVDSLGNLWIGSHFCEWPSFLVVSQSGRDTICFVEAPGLCQPGSSYEIRISSSGVVAREVADSGVMSIYLLSMVEE